MVRRKRFSRTMPWNGPMLSAFLGVGLALFFIHRVNLAIRPMMIRSATAQVTNQVITAISLAVEELPVRYDQVITLEKDGQGKITALQSDMGAIGAYRDQLSRALVKEMDGLKEQSLSIPLGSLTGVDLLSGRGPGIPVKVLSARAVSTAFENVFSEAGINQTRHQIMLNVTVTASILFPGHTTQIEIPHQLCVAETIIVGEVPAHYTYFE